MAVVSAVQELARLGPGDLVLECGAGTGQLGLLLGSRARYVGFDASSAMLEVFRARAAEAGVAVTLVHADGNQAWPAEDRSVRVVFAVRSLHWMSSQHVALQFERVALESGAMLLIGRVERDRDGVSHQMRRALRQLVKQRGYSPRRGEHHARALLEDLCARGATMLEPQAVARWATLESPQLSLAAWREKPGLAGLDLPTHEKHDILSELERWAEETFGNLSTARSSENCFSLQGVHMRCAGT